MIIWLASYPKSGNTWIRSFISSLLFHKSKSFNLKILSNIPQFPLRSHFHNLVKNDEIDDLNKVSSCWIKSQQIINLDTSNPSIKVEAQKKLNRDFSD